MSLIAVKLLLAPSFVVGASLATRRYGPRFGGLLAGLPVVAGPILLAYALAHGRSFAASAAAGTLLGLVSLIGFAVVYGRLAGRARWPVSLLAGWTCFLVGTAIFSALTVGPGVALVLAAIALALGLAWLPRVRAPAAAQRAHPAWDLPLRAGCAMALVLTLTAVSGWLGPQLSGLLTPFPIIATVLSAFTHAQRGAEEAVHLLRSMVSGFVAFALFCFTLAVSLRELSTGEAFALASAVAVAVQIPGLLAAATGSRSAASSARSPGL